MYGVQNLLLPESTCILIKTRLEKTSDDTGQASKDSHTASAVVINIATS